MRQAGLLGSRQGQLVAPEGESPADGGLHHTHRQDGRDDQSEEVDSLLHVFTRFLCKIMSVQSKQTSYLVGMDHHPGDGDAVQTGSNQQQRLKESQDVVGPRSHELNLLDPLLVVVGQGGEGLQDVPNGRAVNSKHEARDPNGQAQLQEIPLVINTWECEIEEQEMLRCV